jgi:hypothetical protein
MLIIKKWRFFKRRLPHYFPFFLTSLFLGLSWGILIQIIIWHHQNQQIIFQTHPNHYFPRYQNSCSPSPKPTPLSNPSPSVIPLLPRPSTSPPPKPVPSPSPLNIPVSDQQLNQWFIQYSQECGVDEYILKYIAQCESKMNPNAVNGLYAGLFQFTPSTWAVTRIEMQADPNADLRFSAEESIRTAAWKIAHGGQGAWPNCLP